MHPRRRRSPAVLALLLLVLSACTLSWPSPDPTVGPSGPAASAGDPATPTPDPTPTPVPEVDVPMAVVTGYTNPVASITEVEVRAALDAREVVTPCEAPMGAEPAPECVPAVDIPDHLAANPTDLALIPAGLVVPTIKVLPVDGADLFGGPEARSKPWPFTVPMSGPPADWAYDAKDVRTLMSLGDSCPDRGVAYAAITLGRGWDWVFGGGTANYTAVYPNPVPAGFVGNGFNIVDAVPAGNEGAVAELVSGADVTLDDFECPVVENWTVNDGTIFSIDPAVLPRLRDTYGVDVATLAANHLFDRGSAGFAETLQQFADAGIPTTGAGMDLDAALEPATVEVDGLTIGFVAFNQIVGSTAAAPGVPGVAWLEEPNIVEAVSRARDVADIVICVPQWWGGDTPGPGAEYHATFRGDMRDRQRQMFDAGCDHVLGHGTHWSGPIEIAPTDEGDHRVTMVSHGNFLFGQEWSQQTQEGVTLELAFLGTELVQARMHPYIMLEQAQTNLTDPETDGLYVLNRIYEASGLPVVAPAPPPTP
ncbi:MAG TPA: CapA family protein [Candidatus Limnocylindria bacterium]|nr:CapA family protein [Candidatus Limnocylindria bacterium]